MWFFFVYRLYVLFGDINGVLEICIRGKVES